MTMLYYVEPRPGNEQDFLRKTVDALKGYDVTVIGFGYPPIYVKVDEAKESDFKAKIVALEGDFKEKIMVYPPFPPNQPRCHRRVYEPIEKCADEDFTKPQPDQVPFKDKDELIGDDEGQTQTPADETSEVPDNEQPENIQQVEAMLDMNQKEIILRLTNGLTENEFIILCDSLYVDYNKDLSSGERIVKVNRLVNLKGLVAVVKKAKELYPDIFKVDC